MENLALNEKDELPASVQEQEIKACELWLLDPYHRSLQLRRISQRQPIYSAYVSLNYRVHSFLKDDRIYSFWIGAHAEYDELTKRWQLQQPNTALAWMGERF
jgi:hypothetical protein